MAYRHQETGESSPAPEYAPVADQIAEYAHPHCEGVFIDKAIISPLPLKTYATEVETSYRKHRMTTRDYGYGTTWLEEWRMSDGTAYNILIGEPEKRKTDIIVSKDTAWGTQVEGFNVDIARELMRLGFPVLIKGPEKGTSISLSHSAHNTHKILDEADKIGINEPKVATVEGYSRGAMIGLGTNAYAEQHGRKIVYSNLTDPCLAHALKFSPGSIAEEAYSWGKEAPTEVLTGVFQLGMLALNPVKLFHYRKTVDISPEGGRQFIRTGRPLFTGEAGMLARHFPEDGQATVVFFRNSPANHQAEFIDILKGHEGVEIKKTGFGHITGMDKRILGNIVTRFSGLVDQLQDGVHHSEIDYARVHKPKA